jgi:mannose-6-phosphate isomerase-like protein (cupin superfamily)
VKTVRVEDVTGETFPAGRRTRILIGPGSVEARNFVMGHVTIFPDGSVPLNQHEQEEVYVILQGSGSMRVGDEEQEVCAGTAVYVSPGVPHQLKNTGPEDLIMMFVYSPAGVVSHWQKEREGDFKIV